MLSIGELADGWANKWAIHSLEAFNTVDPIRRARINTFWNWGFLFLQVVALLSYEVIKLNGSTINKLSFGLSFSIAVYGWMDISLCVIRKSFLLHFLRKDLAQANVENRVGSAWLMFVSLTVIYANLFFVIGKQFEHPIKSAADAFAFSASTITTVGYGYYSPINTLSIVLAYIESISGLALVSCVIASAVAKALERTPKDFEDNSISCKVTVSPANRFFPWIILLVTLVTINVLYFFFL